MSPASLGVSVLCLLLSAVQGSSTAPATQTQPVGAIDPKADRIVHQAADYLLGQKAFRVTFDWRMKTTAQGMTQEMDSVSTGAVQRPDRFALRHEQGASGITVVCDGKKVHIYIPMLRKYMVKDAGHNPLAVIENARGISGPFSPEIMFPALAGDKPYEWIMEDVDGLKYIGLEKVDGVECHRLRMIQEGIDVDVWIRAGEQPVLVKFVPDLRKAIQQGVIRGAPEDLEIQAALTLKDWSFEKTLPEDAFVFVPPAGAQKVDSLFGSDESGEEEIHALVGTQAPAVTLNLLDGQKVELASLKDKYVVVLDFWATWCPPCVRGLPKVSAVAQSFLKEGVRFYAVNQGEPPEKIRAFLKDKGLTIPVALDLKKEIGGKYGVKGIPQTVVIDKQGKVQVVHVGFAPGMEEELRGQIRDVLDGKDLTKKADSTQDAKAE